MIVADRHGTGTNALVLSPPDAIEPAFGPGSFARHVAAAEAAAACRTAPKRCPALRSTWTRPADLAELAAALEDAPWPGALDARGAPPARARRGVDRAPGAGLGLTSLSVSSLAPLPPIRPGDDLAGLIAAAAPEDLGDGDVLVVAHKVVSKAEGRVRRLEEIEPGERARALADEHRKDARLVQAVLDESAELLRAVDGTLICVTHHGFVCANAGVDQSNASAEGGELVLLPEDPDGSAARLRSGLADGARRAAGARDR